MEPHVGQPFDGLAKDAVGVAVVFKVTEGVNGLVVFVEDDEGHNGRMIVYDFGR